MVRRCAGGSAPSAAATRRSSRRRSVSAAGRRRRHRQQAVRVVRGACDRSSGDGPCAQAVDGAAARDGDHPGDGAAASGVELGRPPPHFQEGLLDDVLGLFPVAQDPERDRDRPRRVLVVERPQRRDVAAGDAREKLPVARPIARTGGHGGYEFGQAPFNIGCANQRAEAAPPTPTKSCLLELRSSAALRTYASLSLHRRGTARCDFQAAGG